MGQHQPHCFPENGREKTINQPYNYMENDRRRDGAVKSMQLNNLPLYLIAWPQKKEPGVGGQVLQFHLYYYSPRFNAIVKGKVKY